MFEYADACNNFDAAGISSAPSGHLPLQPTYRHNSARLRPIRRMPAVHLIYLLEPFAARRVAP